MPLAEPVLCYIEDFYGSLAYFTTQALDKQWGDDWNDAPYEHNAGTPYEWRAESGEPSYEIVSVWFRGNWETPAQRANSHGSLNSPYSVESINFGRTPWLSPCEFTDGLPIMAGTTLSEFKRIIKAHGGVIYSPEGEPLNSLHVPDKQPPPIRADRVEHLRFGRPLRWQELLACALCALLVIILLTAILVIFFPSRPTVIIKCIAPVVCITETPDGR